MELRPGAGSGERQLGRPPGVRAVGEAEADGHAQIRDQDVGDWASVVLYIGVMRCTKLKIIVLGEAICVPSG